MQDKSSIAELATRHAQPPDAECRSLQNGGLRLAAGISSSRVEVIIAQS